LLLHNLIDFAIFEPGILTALFAALACLVALDSQKQTQAQPAIGFPVWLKIPAAAIALLIGFAYFNYALVPVVKSNSEIEKAGRFMAIGQASLSHYYLDAATASDPYGSQAPLLNGNLYIQNFYRSNAKNEELFNSAEQALFTAALRNPHDYHIYDSLAELYSVYAPLSPEQNKALLNKALDSATIAAGLYPGDAELHLHLAQIAEELGRNDLALKNYKIAVQIEDGFREQFQKMYPGKKVISRLNEDKYFFATQRIKNLEQTPATK
jgi:hypothetical protein